MNLYQWPRCAVVFFVALGGWSHLAIAIPTPPRLMLQQKSRLVRVLLGNHARFTISGIDLLLNENIKLPGSSAFNVRCGNEPGSGAAYVEFGAGRRSIGKLEIFSAGGFLNMNDRLYRNRLVIYAKGPHCMVVNNLELEKYVAGVISREMAPGWPLEALKAQAVASRSYALYQMNASRNREFDLESSTQDQVYEGAGGEAPSTLQAVEATHGQALTFENNSLKAYFHANCGGITEVPNFVWGGDAKAFRPVLCPYHKKNRDRTRWSVRLSGEQIERALKKITGLLPIGFLRVASVEAGAPNASQRLSDVAVSDTQGNNLLVSANAFRNAIGNTKLKSTAFQVRRTPDGGYTLAGEGNGHGVGMCQIGARSMAKEGRSFEQILQFYYPLAKIRRVL